MDYTIVYYSEEVQKQILDLPDTLAARYIVLTRRMVSLGPNLGEPHTKAFGGGLFELRLKGSEDMLVCSSARSLVGGSLCSTVLPRSQTRRRRASVRLPRGE